MVNSVQVLDGSGTAKNIAAYDISGTGAGPFQFIHGSSNASGTQVNPATSDLQSSVQSSAGSASTYVVNVQGASSGIPMSVALNNTSAAGTSATNLITVQGSISGVKIPVSLSITGTAGTPATDVLSIQGVSSGVSVNTTRTLASASGGLTLARVFSAATVNSTNVSSSSKTIYSGAIINSDTTAIYFKLYNKATAPTVGTDTPILTIMVPATSTVSFSNFIGDNGLYFSSGIGFGITGSIGDSDTTVVTVGKILVQFYYK
jgi:hypothetical protein